MPRVGWRQQWASEGDTMSWGERVSRRRWCTALAVGGASVLGAACSSTRGMSGPPTPPRSSPPAGPTVLPRADAAPTSGKLVIVLNNNLAVVDLETLQARPLTHFPAGAYATSPCLSPDRQQIAFTYFVPARDQTDLGGADLYLIEASGANPRRLHAHPASGAGFEAPAWTADGKAILATVRTPIYDQGQSKGESVAIVRVGLDGSGPVALIPNALGPATSPDGKHLAYSTVDSRGNFATLSIADLSGHNPRPLLTSQDFYAWGSPAFSPDGATLAFAATGGPNSALPSIKHGWVPPGTGIAEAHAAYWEIWTVHPDGTNRIQLTHESEDSPIPAWSPDGKWIAIAGEMGTYVIDATGTRTVQISSYATPGLAWLA